MGIRRKREKQMGVSNRKRRVVSKVYVSATLGGREQNRRVYTIGREDWHLKNVCLSRVLFTHIITNLVLWMLFVNCSLSDQT